MTGFLPLATDDTRGATAYGRALLAWSLLVAFAAALVGSLTLVGRTGLQPSLGWATVFVGLSAILMLWLTSYSRRLADQGLSSARVLRRAVATEAPLVSLGFAASAAIYLSDFVNHQLLYVLRPTASIAVILAVLATAVAHEASLDMLDSNWRRATIQALAASRRWAIPASLVLLGLLQASAYIWVIGNDFTRYWTVADAISSGSGYPGLPTMPAYIKVGEPPYTIELPLFPATLVASFALLGHDSFGGYAPALLANMVFPVLMYKLARSVDIARAIAYAGACAVSTMPFFRLYTLNTPVPDPVFFLPLLGAAIVFIRLFRIDRAEAARTTWKPWVAFGLLGAATVLTRPEGLLFIGLMYLCLLPRVRERGPYLTATFFFGSVFPFAIVMMANFGFAWPNNAGSTMGLHNIKSNLYWLEVETLRWYAAAFQLEVPELLAILGSLALAVIGGTVWMAREVPKWAMLPASGVASFLLVFTVDSMASGARLWFDLFRHISYGIPFMALATLFLIDRLARALGSRRLGARSKTCPQSSSVSEPATSKARVAVALSAVVLLLLTAIQLDVLSRPVQTHGEGATQLLTSDPWASLPELASNRYILPQLQFTRIDGVLTIDRAFDREYMAHHLERVRAFFQPFSAVVSNEGEQYQLSSALVVLFGAVFLLGKPSPGRRQRRNAGEISV